MPLLISPRPLLREVSFQTAEFVIKHFDLPMRLKISCAPLTNSCSIPNVTVDWNQHPHSLEVSYQVKLLWPEYPVPFYLSPMVTELTHLNSNAYVNLSIFSPPYSYDYLNQICPHLLRELTSSTHFCKPLRTTLYFRLRDSFTICTEHLTDPWLEPVNTAVLVN